MEIVSNAFTILEVINVNIVLMDLLEMLEFVLVFVVFATI